MITFENYTDKNEIKQDCLDYIEPFIERVTEIERIKVIDWIGYNNLDKKDKDML